MPLRVPVPIPPSNRETAPLQGRAALPRGSDCDGPLSAVTALAVAIRFSLLWPSCFEVLTRERRLLFLDESFGRGRQFVIAVESFPIHSIWGRRGYLGEQIPVIDEICISLEAKDSAANRLRAWSVEAGRDLFEFWIVTVRFGRIGTAGRIVRYSFPSEDQARAFIRGGLRRRGTAKRRIGVPYCVTDATASADPLLRLSGFPAVA